MKNIKIAGISNGGHDGSYSIFENGIDGSQPPILNDSNCSTENNNDTNT